MTDRGGMPGQSKLWHESKRGPTSVKSKRIVPPKSISHLEDAESVT